MAEENPIDTRLPYRIGYPKLPALPVKSVFAAGQWQDWIPDFNHHMRNVQKILNKYNVSFDHLRLEHRFNDGLEYDKSLPTIVLVAHFQPSSPNSSYNNEWVQAVKEIHESLTGANIYNPVELIDGKAFFELLWYSPILSSDHEIIQESRDVMPDVLQIIDKQDWISVDVFHRDFPSMSQKPTLIISARDANEDVWWDTILPQIRQKTKKLDVVLLFLQSISLNAGSRSMSTIIDEYNSPLRKDIIFIGDSCGLKGSKKSGTLGGKVKLKDNTRELEMGLTNCHVVRFSSKDKPSEPIADSRREIVSVSDEDHTQFTEHLKNSINKQTEDLKEVDNKITFYEEDSKQHQYLVSKRPGMALKLHLLESDQTDVKNLSRNIGSVYADSDFRVRDNPGVIGASQELGDLLRSQQWALDWGLIQLEPSKTISSKLPKVITKKDAETTHETYLTTGLDITEYASMSPDHNLHVMKRGRTTGWSYGVISAIASTLRHQEIQDSELVTPTVVREDISMDDVAVFKNVACYAIAAPRNKGCQLFLEPGDSGSLVLLNEKYNPGVIVGLGFAGNSSSLASYMMPMDLVVTDIEEHTGMEVLEPRYCGMVPEPN